MRKHQELIRTCEQAAARLLDLSGYLSSSTFIHRPFDQSLMKPVLADLQTIMEKLPELGYEVSLQLSAETMKSADFPFRSIASSGRLFYSTTRFPRTLHSLCSVTQWSRLFLNPCHRIKTPTRCCPLPFHLCLSLSTLKSSSTERDPLPHPRLCQSRYGGPTTQKHSSRSYRNFDPLAQNRSPSLTVSIDHHLVFRAQEMFEWMGLLETYPSHQHHRTGTHRSLGRIRPQPRARLVLEDSSLDQG